jgi:hypothetical protein
MQGKNDCLFRSAFSKPENWAIHQPILRLFLSHQNAISEDMAVGVELILAQSRRGNFSKNYKKFFGTLIDFPEGNPISLRKRI